MCYMFTSDIRSFSGPYLRIFLKKRLGLGLEDGPLLSKKMAVISVNPKVFTAIVATILLAYFVTSILLIISVAMVNRKINATMRALQSRLDKPRQQELYDIILQFHVPPSVRANLEEPRLPPPNLKLDSISYV